MNPLSPGMWLSCKPSYDNDFCTGMHFKFFGLHTSQYETAGIFPDARGLLVSDIRDYWIDFA